MTASIMTLIKKVVPSPARSWIRDQQRRVPQQTQDLYDRIIIRKQLFTNREGLGDFTFRLTANHKKQGVSGLLRVKNEADKIYHCLASIVDVFDEIILVDNGSEDRTLEIVRDFKEARDSGDKIKIYSYPFKVSRCGPENLNTPEDSVHSLSYYYNWALSHCTFKYVCKWDGDMILKKEAREPFKAFLKRIQKGRKMCWITSGQTVYRDLRNDFYLAKDEINAEVGLFPSGLNPRFRKVDLFEQLQAHPPLDEGRFDGIVFYELKFTSTDEFSHWSIRDIPTDRKRRERANFELIKAGHNSDAVFEKLSPSFLDDQIG